MNPARKILFGGAMAAAAVTGGAIGASFLSAASAQTATTTQAPAPSSTDGAGVETGNPIADLMPRREHENGKLGIPGAQGTAGH